MTLLMMICPSKNRKEIMRESDFTVLQDNVIDEIKEMVIKKIKEIDKEYNLAPNEFGDLVINVGSNISSYLLLISIAAIKKDERVNLFEMIKNKFIDCIAETIDMNKGKAIYHDHDNYDRVN